MIAKPPRIVRALVGIAVVVALGILVDQRLDQYRESRSADKSGPSADSTSSPAPAGGEGGVVGTQTAAPVSPQTKPVVVILTTSLHLRAKPSSASQSLDRLRKGARVDLLESQKGWHHVRTAEGVTGWVSSDRELTTVEGR